MNKENNNKCPICNEELKTPKPRTDKDKGKDSTRFNCPNCGLYEITRTALHKANSLDEKQKSYISWQIWMNQKKDEPFIISTEHLTELNDINLPNPSEQLDLLVEFLGKNQKNYASLYPIKYSHHRAKIGVKHFSEVRYIVKHAINEGIIEKGNSDFNNCTMRLTVKGWQRFEELKRGKDHSKTAFMAMPFGNDELTKMVDDVFRPAVIETGFKLKRLDDDPKPGLIDDRLRVEIRLCKFLIAEITDKNNGAYWEAGFAEGLGKKVIYTCREGKLDDAHFDVNHSLILFWEPGNESKIKEDLMATIRNAFPFEAKMPEE